MQPNHNSTGQPQAQWSPYPYPYPPNYHYYPSYPYPMPPPPHEVGNKPGESGQASSQAYPNPRNYNMNQMYPQHSHPYQQFYPNQPPFHYPRPPPQTANHQPQHPQKHPVKKASAPLKDQKHRKQPERPISHKRDDRKRNHEEREHSSYSGSASESDEEQLYLKTKLIAKKKDTVMDSPSEIKKWVEARKRNYPGANKVNGEKKAMETEMSILESKIRKKIMLISSDGRGLFKKMKNMDILRRLISENRIDKIGQKFCKKVPNRNSPSMIAQGVYKQIISKQRQDRKQSLERKEIQQQLQREKQRRSFQELELEKQEQEQEQEQEQGQGQEQEQKMKGLQKGKHLGSGSEQDQSGMESQNGSIEEKPIQKQSESSEKKLEEAVVIKPRSSQMDSERRDRGRQNGRLGYNPEHNRLGPTPEEMTKHLKEKQQEDREFYGQLLNYKTNSLNYKYNSQVLDVNFLLEDIFEESSYLLQAIRHMVKNNFFKKDPKQSP